MSHLLCYCCPIFQLCTCFKCRRILLLLFYRVHLNFDLPIHLPFLLLCISVFPSVFSFFLPKVFPLGFSFSAFLFVINVLRFFFKSPFHLHFFPPSVLKETLFYIKFEVDSFFLQGFEDVIPFSAGFQYFCWEVYYEAYDCFFEAMHLFWSFLILQFVLGFQQKENQQKENLVSSFIMMCLGRVFFVFFLGSVVLLESVAWWFLSALENS